MVTGARREKKFDPFRSLTVFSTSVILVFILLPLVEMVLQPSIDSLQETIRDKDVLRAIWLSVYASGLAALISFVFGTPFAFLLARKAFFGKRFVESVVDLPVMIPHPVVGIAILSLAGREHWLGRFSSSWACHFTSMRQKPGSKRFRSVWRRCRAAWEHR